MTRRTNRRLFLRGLGGACVAAPFLGSLGGRGAKAEEAPSPKRLIVMFTHYGCITTRFFPARSHGTLTAEHLESTTLRPLAPFVDKLLMPRGIRAMNEWTATMVRGQGNDYHTQVVGTFFTCQPVTPNSDDPFNFNQAVKFDAMPVGPSLDHVIAQQLSPNGAPLFMRVGNKNDSPQSGISYSAPETPYDGLGSLPQIFAGLTGLFQAGAPPSPDTYQAVRGKSVIDLVRDDLETLQRFDMSQSDRDKLEAWKALVHDTGVAVGGQCSAEVAASLGVTQENVDAPPSSSGSTDIVTSKVDGTDLDVADLYSNLAVLAAVCNANPVIFLKFPGNYTYSGLGVSLDIDSANHRLNNANLSGTCVPGVIDMLLTVESYYAQKFAHLVAKLDVFQEGDGTVLDNSAVVWFQEASDGCAHNLNNLPIVQIGSAGGYFKTGCAVNVDDGAPDLTRGNSESVCAPGTPDQVNAIDQSTGTDPSLANAPINKYYCNLMNALGVKAGRDGFPFVGGSEPVTHYGMYDRTEDFIGGGTNPPTIHDPGEFSELRANS
jgi:hypothetical protein